IPRTGIRPPPRRFNKKPRGRCLAVLSFCCVTRLLKRKQRRRAAAVKVVRVKVETVFRLHINGMTLAQTRIKSQVRNKLGCIRKRWLNAYHTTVGAACSREPRLPLPRNPNAANLSKFAYQAGHPRLGLGPKLRAGRPRLHRSASCRQP